MAITYKEAQKLQGRTFWIRAGAFKGREGTLQSMTRTTGELAFPSNDAGKIERLWFQYEDLELATRA